MTCITITKSAHDELVAHASRPMAPPVRNNGATIDIEVSDDVLLVLMALSPNTGNHVHDMSEAVKQACRGVGRA